MQASDHHRSKQEPPGLSKCIISQIVLVVQSTCNLTRIARGVFFADLLLLQQVILHTILILILVYSAKHLHRDSLVSPRKNLEPNLV